LTFDQLWIAGDDDAVHGAMELGDFDEDAVIVDNPNEEMSKPQKRKLGAEQASVPRTRMKHAPKQRTVPLTEEQIQRKRQKIQQLKKKKAGAPRGGQAANMLKVLTESAEEQAQYFWSEYCTAIGADLSIAEITDSLPATGIHALGKCSIHLQCAGPQIPIANAVCL